ncbi:MAG TPA: DUF6194 family protein [Verrucomicrobiae bacterium]|nr:DUF6194 family protein [Verrucomicrobiae bacterium]
MNETDITHYITATFPAAEMQVADGNFFFFFGAERMMPFATLMTNAAYDPFSNLDRPGVFRLNMGVSKKTFSAQLGDATGGSGHDLTALDKLMPHPEYGKLFWVCVLNPAAATWETVKKLLAEAYALAEKKQTKS